MTVARAGAPDRCRCTIFSIVAIVIDPSVARAISSISCRTPAKAAGALADLDAVFFWSQEGARRLIASGKAGAIVNIASIAGLAVSECIAAYAVAKAGVVQLTKALGLELAARGIRVNAIAPGWIATDLNREYLMSDRGMALKREIPLGRFGEGRDLDGALLRLASDAGRYMTGTTVVVDRGQIVGMRG